MEVACFTGSRTNQATNPFSSCDDAKLRLSMSTSVSGNSMAADRVPLVTKLAYSAGVLVNNLQAAAIPAMAVILNLGLGIDPVLVGIIGFVPRIFDAITDPVMGYLSDNTRSRWGRRRPYIFAGAIISGLLFASMWQVPNGYSQQFYFITFLVAFVLYFLCYSLFATPIIALGYELTDDYDERTRLHAFANTVGQLAWLSVPWFYALMANEELFANEVEGARTLAIYVGMAILGLGLLPAIYCNEKPLADATGHATGLPAMSFSVGKHLSKLITDMREALACSPFRKLCATTFLVFNGYMIGNSFTLYVLIYYVFGEDKELAGAANGMFGTITSACSLAAIPLAGWIATKIGKREAFLLAMSLSIVGYVLKWFGYNPESPKLLFLACPFLACGIGTLFTLMNAMVADVCDYDELNNQERRKGLFGAIYWWMVKIGMALSGLTFGLLLDFTGFDVKLTAQSANTLQWMRFLDVSVPIVATLIAIWVISKYDLKGERVRQIRDQLEQRRGDSSED